MTKILITGGAGFIASMLAAKLAENEDNDIVIVDNFVTGTREKLPIANNPKDSPNIHFVKCDVNNYESISSIFYSHGFDYVFHYAALVGVQRTLRNPHMVLNDIAGIKNIVKYFGLSTYPIFNIFHTKVRYWSMIFLLGRLSMP